MQSYILFFKLPNFISRKYKKVNAHIFANVGAATKIVNKSTKVVNFTSFFFTPLDWSYIKQIYHLVHSAKLVFIVYQQSFCLLLCKHYTNI